MPTQVVNGAPFQQYSPEWYAAQQADTIRRQGIAGTAAGTGEANYLNALSPSLAGLYSATGLGGTTSGTSGTGTSPVSYQAPVAGSFDASSVAPTGLSPSGTPGSTPTATIAPLDLSKASTAAFATAKDQAARTAAASLTGLNQALTSRGLGGAGYEAGQVGNTLAQEANTIGEAGRAEAAKEADLQAQAAEANLGAEVTQRGQDIGAQQAAAERALQGSEAAFSGGIAQRGQDIGSREAAANLAAEEAGSAFSGGIAQRGQTIQQQEAAATLAQQQAALRSNQKLEILRSVLGGGPSSNAGAYVY